MLRIIDMKRIAFHLCVSVAEYAIVFVDNAKKNDTSINDLVQYHYISWTCWTTDYLHKNFFMQVNEQKSEWISFEWCKIKNFVKQINLFLGITTGIWKFWQKSITRMGGTTFEKIFTFKFLWSNMILKAYTGLKKTTNLPF